MVLQNGYLTDSFPDENGTRQGDPISPYLFVLGVQIHNIQIHKKRDIKGITINEID